MSRNSARLMTRRPSKRPVPWRSCKFVRRRLRTRHRRLRAESLESRRVLATFVVSTAADIVDAGDGVTSLREAIQLANNQAGDDTITFDPAAFADATTIDLQLGELSVAETLVITGPDANLTIDAGGLSRILNVDATTSELTLHHLTLQGGRTSAIDEGGGAIKFSSGGTLRLSDVNLVDNATSGDQSAGGALFSLGGTVIENSLVVGNATTGTDASGGGVYVRGSSLTINDSDISGNNTSGSDARGGGVYAYATTFSIDSSSVTGNRTSGEDANGGGIFAIADVTLTSSSISGNRTEGEDADGGGVSLRGNLTITTSTVDKNQTGGRYAGGGGIAVTGGSLTLTTSSVTGNQTSAPQSEGGGILSVRSVVQITDTTLSSNSASGADSDGGGLASLLSDVTIVGSTVTLNSTSGDGGGISFFDNENRTLSIQNSIVAVNTDGGAAPDFQPPPSAGSLTVVSSLIGDNTGTTLSEAQTPDLFGNLVGDPSGDGLIDPLLGPLTFGGTTFYHSLLDDSPAIDAGDDVLVTTTADGRGEPFSRVSGASVDIGSFERQTIDPLRLVVTTENDELDFGNGDISLREAITLANGNPGLDNIAFDLSVFDQPQTIQLVLGELKISETLNIAAADNVTLDGQGNSRVLNLLESAGDVTLSGMTITGGTTSRPAFDAANSSPHGGGIRFASDGLLSITGVTVAGNQTRGEGSRGGGVFAASGQLLIDASSISNNQTVGDRAAGGGIASESGGVTITDTNITDNSTLGAQAGGGGIHVAGGDVQISGSTVSGNQTAGVQASGGAIAIDSGTLEVIETSLLDNQTDGQQASGGAIHSESALVTLNRANVSNNAALGNQASGGGIATPSLSLRDSTVSGNMSTLRGGGIDATETTIINSTVSGNQTSGDGGGLFTSHGTIVASTVTGNVSGQAGGIAVSEVPGAAATIHNTILAGNNDSGGAPDLYHPPGHAAALSITFSLIGDNRGTDLQESQTPNTDGNLIGSGVGAGVIDPGLSQLGNHGGFVPTHSLDEDSPAINRGDPNPNGFDPGVHDTRGAPFRRIAAGVPDIGALERQQLDLQQFIVTSNADELDYSDDEVTLREAIQSANGSVGADIITFDPSAFSSPQTIDLLHGELDVSDGLTIIGPGSNSLTIDAGGKSRVLRFRAAQGDLVLSGMTITGGDVSQLDQPTAARGGGILFAPLGSGQLSISDLNITGNTATFDGGGLMVVGEASVVGSRISDNLSTDGRGGGIRADTLSIHDSVVSGNTAQLHGGGIDVSGDITIARSTIENNQSIAGVGGGAYGQSNFTVSRSTIMGNTSGGSGGGIHSKDGATVTGSTIAGNRTTQPGARGGGIYADPSGSQVLLSDSTLSGNATLGASSDGGGVYSPAIEVLRSTIVQNTATRTGGGVLTLFSGSLSIISSILAMNSDSGIAPNFRSVANPQALLVRASLIDNNIGTTLGEAQTPDLRGNLVGRPVPAGSGIIDPRLDPLTEIGGIAVHPLLAASPAINAGDDSGQLPEHDQRGAPFVRVSDGGIDMGAFESQPPAAPVISWNDPESILQGTPLGDKQLGATTNTPGTFVYTPGIGTVLNVGLGQALSVDFTPDDTNYFVSTSAMVAIDVLAPFDFGDAPDSFATLLASDGPRHAAGSLRLGSSLDFETDGEPTARAGGDGADEDGVVPISSLVTDSVRSSVASLMVTASASAKLDAWIDFNGNGVFDHPEEHLGGGTSIDVSRGENVVEVNVPAGAVAGEVVGRFRLSSDGSLLPTGEATDGEVEDHEITIFDGGDLPVIDLVLPRGPATLSFELGELFVTQGGDTLFRAPSVAVGRYNILGTDFSDILILDHSDGDPLPTGGMTYDAGDRVNTLRLIGPGSTLDTTSDSGVSIRNIDVIDLTDAGAKTVIVDAASVQAMDPTGGGVIVSGTSADRVVFDDSASWRMAEPIAVAGFSFSNVVTLGTFVQVDFGSPWQNLARPSDVGNDGNVTAGDALRIINELGRRTFSDPSTAELKDPGDVQTWPNIYFDQNGDGNATALDALRVINELARIENSGAQGEGELAAAPIGIPFSIGDDDSEKIDLTWVDADILQRQRRGL